MRKSNSRTINRVVAPLLRRFTAVVAAGALLTTNLAGGILLLEPTPASAKTIFTIEIPGPLLASQTVQAAAETSLTAKDTLLDTIAYTVINAIIVGIVRKIIEEVIKQVEGIPDSATFVTDLKGLMRTLADRGVNAALIDAGFDPYAPGVGESWCNPFGGGGGGGSGGGGGGGDDDGGFVDKAQQEVQKQVRQAIQRILDQYELQRGSASRRIRCSLITYSNDPRAFISGDFSQGGLAAWFAYVRDSNPIALRFQLEDEISRRIAEEQGTEQTLLSWNQGFFSPPDLNACYGDGGILLSITANEPPLSDCLRVSPGSIIKDQLERVLGMNLDRLANADEINEFIGAAVTLLIDQLFQGGGLLGANKTGEGGKSFLEKLEEDQAQELLKSKEGILKQIDAEIAEELELREVLQCDAGANTSANATLRTQTGTNNTLSASQAASNEVVATLRTDTPAKTIMQDPEKTAEYIANSALQAVRYSASSTATTTQMTDEDAQLTVNQHKARILASWQKEGVTRLNPRYFTGQTSDNDNAPPASRYTFSDNVSLADVIREAETKTAQVAEEIADEFGVPSPSEMHARIASAGQADQKTLSDFFKEMSDALETEGNILNIHKDGSFSITLADKNITIEPQSALSSLAGSAIAQDVVASSVSGVVGQAAGFVLGGLVANSVSNAVQGRSYWEQTSRNRAFTVGGVNLLSVAGGFLVGGPVGAVIAGAASAVVGETSLEEVWDKAVVSLAESGWVSPSSLNDRQWSTYHQHLDWTGMTDAQRDAALQEQGRREAEHDFGTDYSGEGWSVVCLSGKARITLPGNTTIPIADIQPGMVVLNGEGEPTRVKSVYRRVVPPEEPLFRINNTPTLATAGHPFLTPEGWKAVDPAVTARENPLLEVAPLRVGDRIVHLGGTHEVVRRIDTVEHHEPVVVYNLFLEQGATYIADNRITHNYFFFTRPPQTR
ncbi:MAG: hypothetical protein KatS3mg099_234 [Candidatus Parcubacteria bacterium]|nr:MAG: hypothetical protein KatS3mg099_234 [Candidatus Parcubacteria bacterium]